MDTKTWKTESGVEYPLFAFDEPPVVRLPNGTEHYFRMWDEATEKRREDLMKTVIISSPAVVNGENPRDVKTDFSRAAVWYYDAMIERVAGVAYNGNDPSTVLEASTTTGEKLPNGKEATIRDLIGVAIKKAASLRLYGGKVEVERPAEAEEDFEGDPFDEDDIQRRVETAEAAKQVYSLTLERTIVIRQELGVEMIHGTGRTTDPTHVIRYHFREPSGDEFSRWELKGYRGYSVGMRNGGERSERFYNLETVRQLFDALIERIDGASAGGSEITLPSDRNSKQREALLAAIPLSVKKLTVATLFAEMNSLGNS